MKDIIDSISSIESASPLFAQKKGYYLYTKIMTSFTVVTLSKARQMQNMVKARSEAMYGQLSKSSALNCARHSHIDGEDVSMGLAAIFRCIVWSRLILYQWLNENHMFVFIAKLLSQPPTIVLDSMT